MLLVWTSTDGLDREQFSAEMAGSSCTSGRAASRSHLLTAWGLTFSSLASASWVTPR